MKAYLFWYRIASDTPTEYIYIIAKTLKQARYYWYQYKKETLGYVDFYDLNPVDEIEEKDFLKAHKIGEILGQYGTI